MECSTLCHVRLNYYFLKEVTQSPFQRNYGISNACSFIMGDQSLLDLFAFMAMCAFDPASS